MSHLFAKIWIHAIWSTKNRAPLISNFVEDQIFLFIKKEFEETGCIVKEINGMPDHIHCLFRLSPQKSIVEVIKQIKGSSSHFINQQNLIRDKFSWQTGYGAYSVSESVLPKVVRYIQNQKQHHHIKTFQEEYEDFLNIFGFNENGTP